MPAFSHTHVQVLFAAQLSGLDRLYAVTASVALTFRPCVRGEQLKGNVCQQCPAGTYNLRYDPTAATQVRSVVAPSLGSPSLGTISAPVSIPILPVIHSPLTFFVVRQCTPCPAHTTSCIGGQIAVAPGYWRPSPLSTVFLACPFPAVRLGCGERCVRLLCRF